MATMEHMILDKNTHVEEDVKLALEQVCVLMPMTVADDCLTFVDQYTESLVEMLVHGLKPATVCQELTLCQPPKLPGFMLGPQLSVGGRIRRSVTTDKKHQHTCMVCAALHHNPTNHAHVCDTAARDLPDLPADHCSWVSGKLQQLDADPAARPSDVCGQVHAPCGADSGLVGSNRCTWGPSFWCDKHINSMSCGVNTWCQEKK